MRPKTAPRKDKSTALSATHSPTTTRKGSPQGKGGRCNPATRPGVRQPQTNAATMPPRPQPNAARYPGRIYGFKIFGGKEGRGGVFYRDLAGTQKRYE
ncbi:MAG: hypothetical protein Q7I94_04855 [Candidatus Contubernalis sp.]|nr:hypothetical protein [Candidatus Contubernalis sp.]